MARGERVSGYTSRIPRYVSDLPTAHRFLLPLKSPICLQLDSRPFDHRSTDPHTTDAECEMTELGTLHLFVRCVALVEAQRAGCGESEPHATRPLRHVT